MDHLEQEVQGVWEDRNLKNEMPDQEEGDPNQGQIEEELGKDLKKVAPSNFYGKAIRGGWGLDHRDGKIFWASQPIRSNQDYLGSISIV